MAKKSPRIPRTDRDDLREFLARFRPDRALAGGWGHEDFKRIRHEAWRLYNRSGRRVDWEDCWAEAAAERNGSGGVGVTSIPSGEPGPEGFGEWYAVVIDPDAPSAPSATKEVDRQRYEFKVGGRAKRYLRRRELFLQSEYQRTGIVPTRAEVAARLGPSVKSVEQLEAAEVRMARIDAEIDIGDGELDDLRAVIADPHAAPPVDLAILEQQRRRLRELLNILPPAEKAAALEQSREGISKQAVHQARQRAIAKMRAEAEARGWLTMPDDEAPGRKIDIIYKVRPFWQAPRLRYMPPATLAEQIAMAEGRDWGARPAGAVSVPDRVSPHWKWAPGDWPDAVLRDGKWTVYRGPRHWTLERYEVLTGPATLSSCMALRRCCYGEGQGEHDRACPHKTPGMADDTRARLPITIARHRLYSEELARLAKRRRKAPQPVYRPTPPPPPALPPLPATGPGPWPSVFRRYLGRLPEPRP